MADSYITYRDANGVSRKIATDENDDNEHTAVAVLEDLED